MPKKLKYPELKAWEKEPDSPKVVKAKAKKAAKDKKIADAKNK